MMVSFLTAFISPSLLRCRIYARFFTTLAFKRRSVSAHFFHARSKALLGSLFSFPRPSAGSHSSLKMKAIAHKLILVVEDDAEMREALSELLRGNGYAVDCAQN